jgi:hypothetical protein
MIPPLFPSNSHLAPMSTLIPAALALMGLGMFAGSLWLQEREIRSRNRPEPVREMTPAIEVEEEEDLAATTFAGHPLAPR